MNRRFVAVLGGFAGLLVSLAFGADWPGFLGPHRNGVSAETGLLQTWPKQGPPLLWERPVGEGYSAPVIAGKRLILFHRVGDEEVVEALDAVTGKDGWKFTYPTNYVDDFGKGNGPRSTPLVVGEQVFTLGAEGELHCLGLESGKKVWHRSLSKDYRLRRGFFGVGTSPLVEGDLLLINVGAKDAGIVAFDRKTGKEMWKATDHEASYSSPIAVTIDGTRHLFFFTREGLVSLDPKDGTIRFSKRWRSRFEASANAATPVVVNDHLFLSASYNTGAILLKVRKDGVDEVWSNDESLSNHFTTSIHKDGFLYGFDGRQEKGGRLRCVEFKTGKVRWNKDGLGCGCMMLADGNLILLSEHGDLLLVEPTPEAYREKARADRLLTGPCRAPLALSDGRLYARGSKKLICWNLKKE